MGSVALLQSLKESILGQASGEALGIEVGENESLIESNFAGCRVRARHRRIGEGSVGGTDLEILRGGDGGQQNE